MVVCQRPTAPELTFQRPRGPDVAFLVELSSVFVRESIEVTGPAQIVAELEQASCIYGFIAFQLRAN